MERKTGRERETGAETRSLAIFSFSLAPPSKEKEEHRFLFVRSFPFSLSAENEPFTLERSVFFTTSHPRGARTARSRGKKGRACSFLSLSPSLVEGRVIDIGASNVGRIESAFEPSSLVSSRASARED